MELDLSKKDQVANDGGPSISFPLLQLITEARSEHGMRVQDYTRYRHYCAAKVHRLRELLQLTYSDGTQKAESNKAKSAKTARAKKPKKAQVAAAQSAAAKGHGNVFTPRTLDVSQVKDDRSAQLLLFESERAWAYSQELRRETDPSDQKRGYSRLRRAVKWSTSLYELVDSLSNRFDIYARAETAAYKVIIKANAIFDHGKWDKNLEAFSVARLLLNAIAENSKTSRAEALANSFIDSSEGQMRYCIYQLQLSGQDLDEIARTTTNPEVCEEVCPGYAALLKELSSAKKSGADSEKQSVSLSWHGHQIPVRNPELLDTIVHAQDEETLLRDSIKVEALDEQAAESHPKKGTSETDTKRVRLSHAQRKAKKRELTQGAGSGSAPASSSTARLGKAGRTELDPFDRALSAMTDAESVARKLVDDNAETLSKNAGSRQEMASKDLQTAHDYIFYRLLALRVWRNLRLVAEVERRAEKRDRRAANNVEVRLSKPATKTSSKSKTKSNKKPVVTKKSIRKEGSKPKKTTTAARKGVRKPARSGTRALRSRQALARENRAKAVASQKAKRRGARAVPSLAKLLDAAETSLAAMGSISLIESEPDVSSLVEAKAAWFRSEVLRHLARAFSLSGAHAEAVLLLTRAQLYIRQARQAADLAEDVDEEDSDFPPRIKADNGSTTVFDHSDHVLASLKHATQKTMYRDQQKPRQSSKKVGASAMSSSRAGQTLQEMARKYIDFDPVSIQEARQIPSNVRAEVEHGEYAAPAAKAKKTSRDASIPSPVAQHKQALSSKLKSAEVEMDDEADDENDVFQDQDEEEHAEESGDEGDFSLAYDPGNATDDEQEDANQVAAQKKGWLGGWFGRK